jgi:hypothetical protein
MNHNTDVIYIRQCLELIEARWQRGPSGEWKSYDFEKLSDDIFDATEVSLSISTLKRLFGKVTYNNLPSGSTLNTLARFAGFEDWNAFKRREVAGTAPEAAGITRTEIAGTTAQEVAGTMTRKALPQMGQSTPGFGRARAAKKKLLWWPFLILPLAALAYLFLNSTRVSHRGPINPSSYSFSCNKVLTEGVPNSVVFHYDALAAPSDSVFIVQTWDMSRRTLVSRAGHAHSAIYYYPGYFNAKLVIDTQIVQTRGLMIGSGGWLAVAEGDPTPFYFKKEEYMRKEGEVVVDSALLAKNHLPLYPRAPWIRIYYTKDMGLLPDDNFTFETTLRMDRNSGAEACQPVEILILCKDDVFIIPLSAPACIGDLSLYAQGKSVTSKEADLSGFGADLTRWTTLKIETVNRHIQFTVNNKPAYSLDFPNPPADIVGVQYRFRGGGSVRDTRFISRGRTIGLK